jgi:hypothetical protein
MKRNLMLVAFVFLAQTMPSAMPTFVGSHPPAHSLKLMPIPVGPPRPIITGIAPLDSTPKLIATLLSNSLSYIVKGKSNTGRNVAVPITATVRKSISLADFAMSVDNGQSGIVQGVFVSQTLALRVVQQPAGNAVFVSSAPSVTTQFALATEFGTTGFIAHNSGAGALFFDLKIGQEVDVVYGEGEVRRYVVANIRRFQALRPSDPYSPFVDLDRGGDQLTSTDVFQQEYSKANQVVFQTCITADGDPAWGRLFVTATMVQ